jgi:hypothetical protein
MEILKPETSEILTPTDASLVHQGFLLKGQTLEQVMKRDEETLKILGYTTQEVADLLGPVCERACQENSFEYSSPNEKLYQVEVERFRGKPCPWGDRFNLKKYPSSVNIRLIETSKPEKILIAGLLRHLIEKHSFFEGGAYRVAPETLIEMFGEEKQNHEGSIERAKSLPI